MFHIMPPNSMSRDNRINQTHSTRTKAIVNAALPMAGIIVVAALLSGLLPLFSTYTQPAIAQQQNMTGTNATTTGGGGGAQSSSACTPTQTGGGGGGQNATTSTAGAAAGGGGNQSTTSEVRMHIEEACMAAQSGDMQGVLMHLNLALNVLGASGTQGNMTSSSSSNASTTGNTGTTAGNQTVGGPLALYGGGGGQ